MNPLDGLRDAIVGAAAELGADGTLSPALERPPNPELGDYSTNAAMILAPALRRPPREVASALADRLSADLGEAGRVEVAGPGFLNLTLSDRWHREATATIVEAGARFGADDRPAGARVLVEFVSANPTGPLHVGGGRHAAYGDAVARVLEFAGELVEREYYVNDAGRQVDLFAASVAARLRGEDPPEGGYPGSYVAELASELANEGASPDDLEDLGRRATAAMRRRIEVTLERFGVHFDVWSSERGLRESGKLDETIEALRAAGHVYEHDGAAWLRTSSFGDDKDRVLVRSSGEPTYFAIDIAYHRDKLDRGAERLVDPLGSDHHGYVPRMRAALAALGFDPDRYQAPIIQFVHLVEGSERVQMSKRTGDLITLDELVDDIGVDAARFLMLQRSHDRTVDLDLEVARRQSQDNPVYYVQYAHARIASILRRATGEDGGGLGAPSAEREAELEATAGSTPALEAAAEPAERALIRRLLELPGEIALCAERLVPHRLCAYATATAADFHAFYRDCRVIGAGQGLEEARLGVCLATRRTIATTLGLLGVSAPERM
jgi:arginyl-tRNA synthetase